MQIKQYVKPARIITFDLETGGTEPDAAIFSIGAVSHKLNEDGITYSRDSYFHRLINWANIEGGRTFTRRTLNWWFTDARNNYNPSYNVADYHQKISVICGIPLFEALCDFAHWYIRQLATVDRNGFVIYANGPDFDMNILNHAFALAGVDFKISAFRARSIRNCSDYAGAMLAAGKITEDELRAYGKNGVEIEYATNGFYLTSEFADKCIRLSEEDKALPDALPPREEHCALFDADEESALAVYYHTELNRVVG